MAYSLRISWTQDLPTESSFNALEICVNYFLQRPKIVDQTLSRLTCAIYNWSFAPLAYHFRLSKEWISDCQSKAKRFCEAATNYFKKAFGDGYSRLYVPATGIRRAAYSTMPMRRSTSGLCRDCVLRRQWVEAYAHYTF